MNKAGKRKPLVAARKPIRKFTERKFSDARLKRIEEAEYAFKEVAKTITGKMPQLNRGLSIFDIGERFAKFQNPKKGTFIFVGQAMRPLFETVRAINEVEGANARKTFRYVVAPKAGTIFSQDSIRELTRKIEESGIVSSKQNQYFVVDTSLEGIHSTYCNQ